MSARPSFAFVSASSDGWSGAGAPSMLGATNTRLWTRAGCCSTTSSAILPPMAQPTRTEGVLSVTAFSTAIRSSTAEWCSRTALVSPKLGRL